MLAFCFLPSLWNLRYGVERLWVFRVTLCDRRRPLSHGFNITGRPFDDIDDRLAPFEPARYRARALFEARTLWSPPVPPRQKKKDCFFFARVFWGYGSFLFNVPGDSPSVCPFV